MKQQKKKEKRSLIELHNLLLKYPEHKKDEKNCVFCKAYKKMAKGELKELI